MCRSGSTQEGTCALCEFTGMTDSPAPAARLLIRLSPTCKPPSKSTAAAAGLLVDLNAAAAPLSPGGRVLRFFKDSLQVSGSFETC